MTDTTMIKTAIDRALDIAHGDIEEDEDNHGFGDIFTGYLSQELCDDIFSILDKDWDIQWPFLDENGSVMKPRINPERRYCIGVEIEYNRFFGNRYSAYIARMD